MSLSDAADTIRSEAARRVMARDDAAARKLLDIAAAIESLASPDATAGRSLVDTVTAALVAIGVPRRDAATLAAYGCEGVDPTDHDAEAQAIAAALARR